MTLSYPDLVRYNSVPQFNFHSDSNATVRSLIQAMPNGIVLLDSLGYVKEANQEAIRLLGSPLMGELWRTIIARSFRPQADDGHEVSLHSGKRVKLEISSLTHEPGQLIVLTDLSETRDLLERISHLKRLTEMGRMTASLAHQIRTPLSAAMLYAEHLTRDDLSIAQQTKFARQVQTLLLDLEQQVNDMLLYAKSGEQQVVKLNRVKQIFDTVYTRIIASATLKQVRLNFPSIDPEQPLLANQTALVGALQNVFMNAIQASDIGASVSLRIEQQIEGYLLSIQDQGQGIDAQDLPHIFTPFFTKKSQGTGLGLAVVKTVINAHQGQIWVDSELGKGTEIKIYLPFIHEKKSQEEEREAI